MRYLTMIALILPGCASTSGACLSAAEQYCELCPTSADDGTEMYCACVENGTLTKSEGPDDWFETDKEAEMWCSSLLTNLTYIGPETEAECRGEQAYMNEWGADACDVW